MPITCPNGHVNDAGNRFCDQCGAQLQAAPASGAADIAAAPVTIAAPEPTASDSGSLACPTCGQENLPGTAFCENCGAQLPIPEPAQAQSATAAPASTPAADGTISCPNCGTDNEPGNAFCEQCGASLAAATAAPAAPAVDESGVSAGVAGDEAALDAPGAQSQPATEEAQPPADDATSAETDATIPPLIETPAEQAAPAEVEAPATPAPPEPAVAAEPAESVAPTAAAQPAVETCANCGAELPANAKFCLECGTKVERKPPPAPEPELVRPTNCQNCGAELPANAKFCLECGTKVELIPAGTAKPGAPAGEATYQQASQSQDAGLPSAVDLAMQRTTAPELPSALDVAMQRADAAPVVDQAAPSESAVRTYDAEGAAAAAAPVVTPPTAPAQPDVVQQVPVQQIPVQQAPVQPSGPRLISTDGTTISLPPQSELVVGREDPVSGIHPDIDMTPHGGEAGGVSRRHAILRQQGGQWTVTDLDSTNYTRVDGNRVAPNTDVPLHDGARLQFGRIQFEFHSQ